MPSRRATTAAGLALALALALAAPGAAQFGKNKIQYHDFEWSTYRSPHFEVFYYAAEEHLLPKVVSYAESAYDELSRRFSHQIEEPTPLIFYKTHSEFEQNNIILGFIPEAVGAFATPVRFRMVLPVDLPDAELYQLVLHELTHIFQYHIMYGGKISRSFTRQPPTWLIEGMASYYAEDESTSDRMFMRDAVVNDLVPPITQATGGGFFAYRFGHSVFDFMEERWGDDGILDFLYEYRSSLGANVDRAVRRAFRIEPEDFDADFRRWLREKYLPELVATGEPSYFGRRFFGESPDASTQHFGTAVAPSGDLLATLAATRSGRLDVMVLDTQERRPVRNLTKGWSTEVQYFTAQFATSSRRMGSDLSFSPDGNWIAVFAKREEGRSLALIDVVQGGIGRLIDVGVQQPFAPAFSPDGRRVAYAGSLEGQFDIFAYDLESGEVANLTADERFDGGPVWSPDGGSIVYTSVIGEHERLFRLDLATGERQPLTRGDFNDKDPAFSKDGSRLFFTSDRNGYDNVYELVLASGEILQHTNAVTGCFMPALIERGDDSESLAYVGYWRGSFALYRSDLEEVPEVVEEVADLLAQPPPESDLSTPFEPGIVVAVDDANKEPYGGFKLFLEDGDVAVGVTSDQLVMSRTSLSFSDYLGDKRLFLAFDSISSFSDFDVIYMDLSDRLQWGVQLFDDRTFFLGLEEAGDDQFQIVRGRNAFRQTGARGFLSYPLSFYHRIEGSLAYIFREYDFQNFIFDRQRDELVPFIEPREDDYPELSLAAVGDTTVFAPWGPITGRRWRVAGTYGPDLSGGGGAVTSSAYMDLRQYYAPTTRVNVALRLFGGASWGEVPNVFYFGGLDTVRGFRFREFVGDRAFFANVELRFPLLDALYTPILRFQGIRGRVFVDVGSAWFDYAGQEFDFWDSDNDRLADAVSAYGWGFTIRFAGMDLHWDFAKRWNFDETFDEGFESSFWIGSRF